jgi:hypothetical protein
VSSQDGPVRRGLLALSLTLGIAGVLWSAGLWYFGGVEGEIAGLRVTTHEPLRPLMISAVLLTIFILAGGVVQPFDRLVSALRRLNLAVPALLLAAATTIVGLVFSSTTAAGADAFGYVSQADRWLAGGLRVEQPFMAEVPWPSRRWSFAPLGYRPIEEPGQWAIVPTYSPGLPLIMAGAKWIGGHCALFAIVPIAGGLLVLATFGIGRRFGDPLAGLIAAWLIATSPTFLFMLMWPMTDVPVAAAWAAAFYFAFGRARWSPVAAGALTAIAILIRPNLVAGAAFVGLWYLLRRRWRDAMVFAVSAAPGALITAAINHSLYGSALTSGYGGLGDMFDAANVMPNARLYLSWFVQSQTWLTLAGVVAILLPIRHLWPGLSDRRAIWLAAAFSVGLWAQYFAYLVFESWWYLRFLLASWPFIMLGVGALATMLFRLRHPMITSVAALTVIGLGVANLRFAFSEQVFDLWQGERRYVSAGKLVDTLTPPNSVVFSMQHSGSVRYYGGRMTLRYDILEREWLDRAVAWLESRGVRSYALLEEWEEPRFRQHFTGQARVEWLDAPPLVRYEGPAKIALYDLTSARRPPGYVQLVEETFRDTHCAPPARWPTLIFK